jgi:exonuclease III/predicted negative regulator of RcsB-dependent stress response
MNFLNLISGFKGTPTTQGRESGDEADQSQDFTLRGLGSAKQGHKESTGVIRGKKYLRNHPIRESGENLVRLVIFNTGSIGLQKAREELDKILSKEASESIVALKAINHKQRLPRMDLWVKSELGNALKRLIREKSKQRSPYMLKLLREQGLVTSPAWGAILSRWRLAIYKPFLDRVRMGPKVKAITRTLGNTLISVNVNGFAKKYAQVEEMMEKEGAMIIAMQETLVAIRHYPIMIKGYRTFAKPWEKEFRGQALLVDNRLSAYEVLHEDSKHIMHVKVSGIPGCDKPVHILSVYMPSGGNFRRERTRLFKAMGQRTNKILEEDNNAIILGMGDFNTETEVLDRKLKRASKGINRVIGVGSMLSRFPTNKVNVPKCIDHFIGSQAVDLLWKKARVLREYPISDHRPIALRMRKSVKAPITEAIKMKINVDICRQVGEKLVMHNRWSALTNESGEPEEEDLETLVEGFSKTLDEVTQGLGIKTQVCNYQRHLPRKLKNALLKYKKLGKQLAKATEKGSPTQLLNEKYKGAQARFKKMMKAHERVEKQRKYNKISDAFEAHDHKGVWTQIKALTGQATEGDAPQPVRNKEGELQTNLQDILNVQKEHYQSIMQHDPENLAMDEEYWATKEIAFERGNDLQGLNEELKWREIIMAIRRMRRNTAPGKDGVHVNILKQLVREECMKQLETINPNRVRLDHTFVDLPEEELPEEPLTAMGKALHKILQATWAQEEIPEQWQEVYVCSLLKPGGNPETMDNYRGITLISCALKVLLGLLTERIYEAAQKENIIVPEQGGFRKKEEAIAQFLALSEIVRRRHLDNKPTFGVFVDFKKAYDRVHHGALFRVLEHMGIRGKMLNFIKKLYRDNKVRVRTGGYLSDLFEMLRGNRQGCPLSPLLFIIFINGILKECSAGGVKVPAVKEWDWEAPGALPGLVDAKCEGLMYADDVIALEDSVENAKTVCENLEQWAQKWGMELGISKCGVICWSTDEEIRKAHEETTYMAGNAEIPKVDKYKYLGIWVDERLVESRGNRDNRSNTLERDFAKGQANKGLKALYAMKPFLVDRHIPMLLKTHAVRNLIMSKMLYGAEWLGYLTANAEPMEKVLKKAVSWMIGSEGTNTEGIDAFTLCWEMGIPTIEEEIHARRTRLVAKLQRPDGGIRTWLAALWQEPRGGVVGKKTWVTGSMGWLSTTLKWLPKYSKAYVSRYLEFCEEKGINPDDYQSAVDEGWVRGCRHRKAEYPLREWATLAQDFELTVRSNAHVATIAKEMDNRTTGVNALGIANEESLEGTNENPRNEIRVSRRDKDTYRDEYMQSIRIPKGRSVGEAVTIRNVRDISEERQMARNKSLQFTFYDRHQFGVSRGYLRNAVSRPDLAEGTRWLILIRTGGFPELEDIESAIDKKIDVFRCPLCKGRILERIWMHFMLHCTHEWVQSHREKYLQGPIDCITNTSQLIGLKGRVGQDNMTNEVDYYSAKKVGYALVGGWDHIGDEVIPTYSIGFGQLDHQATGLETYGYVFVAQFLQKVAPIYLRTFGLKEYTAGSVTLGELVWPTAEDYIVEDELDIEHDQAELERAQVEMLQTTERWEEYQGQEARQTN